MGQFKTGGGEGAEGRLRIALHQVDHALEASIAEWHRVAEAGEVQSRGQFHGP
jgi:hypothetical protein